MLRLGKRLHARCPLCRLTYKNVYTSIYEYKYQVRRVFLAPAPAHITKKSTHRAPTLGMPRAIYLHTQQQQRNQPCPKQQSSKARTTYNTYVQIRARNRKQA
ncbi:unnamed protein product [Laminaria digitata]